MLLIVGTVKLIFGTYFEQGSILGRPKIALFKNLMYSILKLELYIIPNNNCSKKYKNISCSHLKYELFPL